MTFFRIAAGLMAAAIALSPAAAQQRMRFPDGMMKRHRIAGPDEVTSPYGYAELFLEVDISPQGDVTAARVSPFSSAPKEDPAAAIAAARQWKFRPFSHRGAPVAGLGTIKISYKGPPADETAGWLVPDAAFPAVEDYTFTIRLVRSTCYFGCPGYQVTIDGHGTVTFDSKISPIPGVPKGLGSAEGTVLAPGQHVTHIERAKVDALLAQFRDAHFFGLKQHYIGQVSDVRTYALTVTVGGRSMTVIDYAGGFVGMPGVVERLEDAVDEASGAVRWVEGDGETLPKLAAEGYDFTSDAAVRMAAIRMFLFMRKPPSSEALVLDMIGRGVPLEHAFVGYGGSEPLGVFLLTEAIKSGRPAIFRYLADRGWLKRLSKKQLDEAFATGGGMCSPALAAELVAAGADPNAVADDKTALRSVVASDGPCSDDGTTDLRPIAAALIRLGANPNARDAGGETLLFSLSDPDLQDMLIASGARVDVRNRSGETALFNNARDDATALGLIEAGSSPLGKDSSGQTLRQIATTYEMPATLASLDAHHIK